MGIKFDDAQLNRRIAEWAVVSRKGVREAVREAATRFTKAAIRNTPPMESKTSPAKARRAWVERLEANYEKRFYKGKWRSKAEMKRILAAKKKQLGREAAGWLPAARELGAAAPAWVKRHRGEGRILVRRSDDSYSVTLANAVPYGQSLLKLRAQFALGGVRRGLEGNIRAMKRKILRSLK